MPGTAGMQGMAGTAGNMMGQVQPNFYMLRGQGISITYVTGVPIPVPPPLHMSPPTLHYEDAPAQVTRDFTGQDIRTLDTELGTEVTVTIQMSIDTGATTATLLIPRINLTGLGPVQFRTYLILARHLGPMLPFGPVRETYRVVPLSGIARRVLGK